MKTVFADSGYWIALLNPRDDLHERAVQVSSRLGAVRIITSEMALVEVLNHFAESTPAVRGAAGEFVEFLRREADCLVVPQTGGQFQDALRLYRERSDKAWSLTDCASILIMESYAVTEALSHDRHFMQAGFSALLR